MEKRYFMTYDGQQVQREDLELSANQGALADDRILTELFRLTPGDGSNVAKAIIASSLASVDTFPSGGLGGLVSTNGAFGNVRVSPFRALIGSAADPSTNGLDAWHDIRSGISVHTGDTLIWQSTNAFTPNSSGDPRWDLVYAQVVIDTDGPSVTRKVKNPTTLVVAPFSVATYRITDISVAIAEGTPDSSPAKPDLPADSGTTYNIPLAYVRIVDGFGATTVVAAEDIYEVAPVVSMSTYTGAATCRPADQQNAVGGVVDSSLNFGYLPTTATRPSTYLPAGMTGAETLLIALDLMDDTGVNNSHPSLGVVDESRDWRNRMFQWTAMASTESAQTFASDKYGAAYGVGNFVPVASGVPIVVNGSSKPICTIGMGQSFSGTSGYPTNGDVCFIVPDNIGGNMDSDGISDVGGSNIRLYVDLDDGKLKVYYVTPKCRIFIWLNASGIFPNF